MLGRQWINIVEAAFSIYVISLQIQKMKGKSRQIDEEAYVLQNLA